MTEGSLRIQNVYKTFPGVGGRITALDGVSGVLEPGLSLLLGPNGAGKSTLLHGMLGLLRWDQGEVLLPLSQQDLGFLPQNLALPGGLTPYECLKYRAKFYAQDLDTVDSFLELGGLQDKRKRRISELSPGMQRALAWVWALLPSPKWLILDEPFTGLDPLMRETLEGYLRSAVLGGLSAVLSTHELDLATRFDAGIMILNRGQVAYTGQTPQQPADLLAYLR